ncbi:hypothetical protein EYF80_024502 [Liparis tanakae]|uniref:Uncharacterized protein n=1 Tax=Liparis tanakae TaxID=230148 RepID=A0A4Z2HHN8_9TELE|nr:hypothetical protein EYF80_024502 [Liparis tanakae]
MQDFPGGQTLTFWRKRTILWTISTRCSSRLKSVRGAASWSKPQPCRSRFTASVSDGRSWFGHVNSEIILYLEEGQRARVRERSSGESEAGAPHPDVLQQPEVAHLVAAALLLEQQGGLDVVGLDAADVVGLLRRGGDRAKFSTSEIMEVLKSVAAVKGRLVTSVMLSLPSGHIPFRTGSSRITDSSLVLSISVVSPSTPNVRLP